MLEIYPQFKKKSCLFLQRPRVGFEPAATEVALSARPERYTDYAMGQ